MLALLATFTLSLMSSATATARTKDPTTWLCRPGQTPDPCQESRSTTVVSYVGGVRQESVGVLGKSRRPVDCFYVYPTVSEQEGPNANLTIEPQETQIAIDQASRFSEDCRVFAPMYPQLTLKAIKGVVTKEDALKAYSGVAEAFTQYLSRYNKGRGIVLIGHSQGALLLENLIKFQFDPNATLRKQLVSAILLGGNVLVPEGQLEGGSFQHEPLCTAANETGCVIAYSTFLKEPPANSFFGRPTSPLLGETPPPGSEVACVNPTLLKQDGSTGSLLPYAPTTPFPGELGGGLPTPTATTPWVSPQGVYQAQCKHENGATWLEPSFTATATMPVQEDLLAHNEAVEELIGPEWGLHLYDVNIALGNLVNTVTFQSFKYRSEH
jgi:hypothetical protein